jgi:hypothetical protein
MHIAPLYEPARHPARCHRASPQMAPKPAHSSRSDGVWPSRSGFVPAPCGDRVPAMRACVAKNHSSAQARRTARRMRRRIAPAFEKFYFETRRAASARRQARSGLCAFDAERFQPHQIWERRHPARRCPVESGAADGGARRRGAGAPPNLPPELSSVAGAATSCASSAAPDDADDERPTHDTDDVVESPPLDDPHDRPALLRVHRGPEHLTSSACEPSRSSSA